MLATLITGALNHLLRAEGWAAQRLRAHAGKQVEIRTGFLDFVLQIDAQGFFAAADPGQEAAVVIELPSGAAFRVLGDRASLFQAAKLSGSADLAETLAFVFRNLQWDVEADLASLVGDIPARRLEMLRQATLTHAREVSARLFGNLAEYASEDGALLAPKRDIEVFGRDVDRLRDDLARLEKRVGQL